MPPRLPFPIGAASVKYSAGDAKTTVSGRSSSSSAHAVEGRRAIAAAAVHGDQSEDTKLAGTDAKMAWTVVGGECVEVACKAVILVLDRLAPREKTNTPAGRPPSSFYFVSFSVSRLFCLFL